jgi:hypothetical protein
MLTDILEENVASIISVERKTKQETGMQQVAATYSMLNS